EKELSYKTLANNFASVSSFYEYLRYEDIVDDNPVLTVRKRYLNKYKDDNNNGHRQVLEVKKLSGFINYIPSIRDKAIVLLFLKTGIRRNELIDIDLNDINWEDYSIQLKPKPKRSNTTVYFDHETASVLKRWKKIRDEREPDTDALFIGETGERLKRKGVYDSVVKWAEKYGFHDPDSDKLEDKFTPHTLRHVFTTYLIRNGMRREYIKELRGDTRGEAMDIYHQIDHDELKKKYQGCIPELGVV
ncbi:MAG: tyrosine-type recombinase/integrase, partial [Elusimicrobiota bacterium]